MGGRVMGSSKNHDKINAKLEWTKMFPSVPKA